MGEAKVKRNRTALEKLKQYYLTLNKSNFESKIHTEFRFGYWYKHLPSDSYAYYNGGVGMDYLTLGINVINRPLYYIMEMDAQWFREDDKFKSGEWEFVNDTKEVVDAFKKYFYSLGYKPGARVKFLGIEYELTDEWYIEKNSVYVIGETRIARFKTHIPIIDEGKKCHGLMLL